MSTHVSPDTDAPAPLLQPAQPAPMDRRRLFLFGIGASVVVTVQLVVLTLIMSPFDTSSAQLAVPGGPPNIVITDDAQAAASSVADAAGAAERTLESSAAAAAAAAVATANQSRAPGAEGVVQTSPASQQNLADQILTQQLAAKRGATAESAVKQSAAKDSATAPRVAGTSADASVTQRVAAAERTGLSDQPAAVAGGQIELAKAANQALAEIAPLPAPPRADAAFFPRPQARPAHILTKRTDLRATTHKVSAVKSAAPLDPRWLSNQAGAHFTLQLVSVSDVARFKKFARNVPESRYMAHLQVAKAGSLRHVLYRGVYRKRAEAERDANEIARITGVKPWIRRIDDVLKEAARGA